MTKMKGFIIDEMSYENINKDEYDHVKTLPNNSGSILKHKPTGVIFHVGIGGKMSKLSEDVNEWNWQDELERADRETGGTKASAEKQLALRRPEKHTGYVAPKTVTGKRHTGKYGTSYSADDEGSEKDVGTEKNKKFNTDALAHAFGLTPKTPSVAAKSISVSKVNSGMSAAQQRNSHLQKHAKALGKKSAELTSAERRKALESFHVENIILVGDVDGIEFKIIKENVKYKFQIFDKDDVLDEGYTPTFNGATVAAIRLIEKTMEKVIDAQNRPKQVLDIARKIVSR